MHSPARFRSAAKLPPGLFHRPRLETLEGRLPTGGILTGLSLGPSALLPGLTWLDADGGTAALALTADQPAPRRSPLDSGAPVATAGATVDPAAVGTAAAFLSDPTVAPASVEALANPLASPLAADLGQALTSVRAMPVGLPTLVTGSAAGMGASTDLGAGSDGPVLAPAQGVGLATLGTAREQLPLAGPSQAVAPTATPAGPATTTPSPAQAAQIRQQYGQLPLSFEANRGQTDARVQFLARGPGYQLFLTSTEAVMTLQAPGAAPAADPALGNLGTSEMTAPAAGPSTVLRMQVLGGNPGAQGVGEQPLAGQVNYFLGNDPRQWHTHVATYGRVDYANVYPGIDLTYYGNLHQLEYDFVVAPGADPSRIRLGFTGADRLTVDGQGALEVHAGGQVLRQQAPVLYQDLGGVRQPVAGRFVLAGQTVGFAVGAYDPSRPLVIDPVLSYSTYLGGSGANGDQGTAIAVDTAGNVYLTGYTQSSDFPTVNAFQPAKGGGVTTYNAFVTKVSADGSSLVYSSYLGGSSSPFGHLGGDQGAGIAVDPAGNAYIIGSTDSPDFPTANAFQPTKGGPSTNVNAFVTKVSADGASLVYSSYLGGSGSGSVGYPNGDYGAGIAVDTAGNAYVTGTTTSTDFPTANAFQATKGGSSDKSNAFITKVSSDGSSLVYSSYLGGSGGIYTGGDGGAAIAVDGAGNAYLTGYASSSDFPTVNAFQPSTGNPDNDTAFITKVSADGSSLVYSSYLGGSGAENGAGIAVDGAGSAYVTGRTGSDDFPTVNAFQPSLGSPSSDNAFITKVSADGSSLVYSSYLGGSGTDGGTGIAVDGAGNAYLTGYTDSPDFPAVNAFQPSPGNPHNDTAFITKVSSDGSSLVYSSYLGGSGGDIGGDIGNGIAVDGAGNAYLTGSTTSPDFPTVNAIQLVKGGTGAFQSTDGGTTWNAIDGTSGYALTNSDVRSLAVDPANPSMLYAGTNGGGIFQSPDAGTTWTASNNGLTNRNVQTVVLAPSNPAVLYAGTNGGGVFQSTDGGNTWTAVNNGLTSLTVQTVTVDPTNATTVYAGFNGAGVFTSTDGGASWSASNSGLTSTNVRSIAVDPVTPATVYVATNGGIFKSTDGGSSWLASNSGLPTNALQSYAVAIDPTAPSTLYTSISYRSGNFNFFGVYKSTDGGADWSSSGLSVLASTLVVDPTTPSTVYAAAGAVYKSSDGGTTWSNTGLKSVQALALDPTTSGTVYAGAYNSYSNAFIAKIS